MPSKYWAPGNRDAVWPSSPMPRINTSKGWGTFFNCCSQSTSPPLAVRASFFIPIKAAAAALFRNRCRTAGHDETCLAVVFNSRSQQRHYPASQFNNETLSIVKFPVNNRHELVFSPPGYGDCHLFGRINFRAGVNWFGQLSEFIRPVCSWSAMEAGVQWEGMSSHHPVYFLMIILDISLAVTY